MSVIYFLIIVFLTLIFYTLISSTIKISLFLTTRKKYEDSRLILPTFTTLLTWVLIFFIWNAFLNRYLNPIDKGFFEEHKNLIFISRK